MIAEAKQQYRGVLCVHCRQPIPLSPSAARKDKEIEEQKASSLDELVVRSFPLRCRACHRESLYAVADAINCEGTPKTRGSQAHKGPLNVSKKSLVDFSDQTKEQSNS
jgi:hypothetical protein